jgi:hypothetical protein
MVQPADIQLPPSRPPRWRAPSITIVVLAMVSSFLVWRGLDFYRQDLVARIDHPDYKALRPSGLIGHGYGIVGTGLILTNLLYLVRRRLAGVLPAWLGSVKAWLDVHVVTGLSGSLLILFHSAFQVRTTIAIVTSASLAVVVMTGLVGLYLHALVPKSGLKRFHERLDELRPLLPGLVANVEDFVKSAPCTRLPADASLFATLITIPRWVLEARARRRGVRRAAQADKLLRVLANTDRAFARLLLEELGRLAAAEVDTHAGSAMMRSWRSIHRFLAILMVLSVSVHIGVAWFYGFRWIWSK